MNDAEYIERLVGALSKVPEKKLQIIEIANRFTKNGGLDYAALQDVQPQVNLAIAEARAYANATHTALGTLMQVKAEPCGT